jgi:hypothetical protein
MIIFEQTEISRTRSHRAFTECLAGASGGFMGRFQPPVQCIKESNILANMKFLFVSTVFALPIPQKAKRPTTDTFLARGQTKLCTLDTRWGVRNIAAVAPEVKCFKQVWCELKIEDEKPWTPAQLKGLERNLRRCVAKQLIPSHQDELLYMYMNWLMNKGGNSKGRKAQLLEFKSYFEEVEWMNEENSKWMN